MEKDNIDLIGLLMYKSFQETNPTLYLANMNDLGFDFGKHLITRNFIIYFEQKIESLKINKIVFNSNKKAAYLPLNGVNSEEHNFVLLYNY